MRSVFRLALTTIPLFFLLSTSTHAGEEWKKQCTLVVFDDYCLGGSLDAQEYRKAPDRKVRRLDQWEFHYHAGKNAELIHLIEYDGKIMEATRYYPSEPRTKPNPDGAPSKSSLAYERMLEEFKQMKEQLIQHMPEHQTHEYNGYYGFFETHEFTGKQFPFMVSLTWKYERRRKEGTSKPYISVTYRDKKLWGEYIRKNSIAE